MKKIVIPLVLLTSFIALISFENISPPDGDGGGGGGTTADYENYPLKPLHFWVQQLSQPGPGGTNMLFEIEYENDGLLPSSVNLYYSDAGYVAFYDDGTNGDQTSGDHIFSAYVTEDISSFKSDIENRISQLTTAGSFIQWEGHNGQVVTTIPSFDFTGFNNGSLVELNPNLTSIAPPCTWNLKKQNSLFITDIKVVEDPARTFNVQKGTGNPTGVYTFGQMIKNIAGTGDVRELLKRWIHSFMIDTVVNGDNVFHRDPYAILTLWVEPWLAKARHVNITSLATLDKNTWEAYWDSTSIDSLMKYAPFKLMAIVNRLDLRGNSAYTGTMTNAGETRFIFTLVDPFTGKIPFHGNQFTGTGDHFIDWKGMNVILEYQNVQSTKCNVKSFAQSWVDLSAKVLGSTDYNDALENVVNSVLAANAAPGKINGSAIARIRTNERIFAVAATKGDEAWDNADWQFRQFTLNSSNGYLQQVPLDLTPVNSSSYFTNLVALSGTYPNPYLNNNTLYDNLIDWAFSSNLTRVSINRGTYNMPNTYPSSSTALRAGSGTVTGDFLYYLDLNWNATTTNYNSSLISTYGAANLKLSRHQLSLNTCQGCHTGETKTIFTQIRSLAYGEEAKYWTSTPDVQTGLLDTRFHANYGNSRNGSSLDSNYHIPSFSPHSYPNVSAFLTGRNYNGGGNYGDDDASDSDDNTIDGLYYVYDPSNWADPLSGADASPLGHDDQKWGYNDLKRREEDLCHLANDDCSNFKVLKMASEVKRMAMHE